MTDGEICELRELLALEVAAYRDRGDFITDAQYAPDETTTFTKTSTAEMLVFGLTEDIIPFLQVAMMGYEVLLDIVHPPYSENERLVQLIEKARDIAPPVESFGNKIPFAESGHDLQSFSWFAKAFLDVSHRQAAAIYAKNEANMRHLIVYEDETEPG